MKNIIAAIIVALGLAVGGVGMANAGGKPIAPQGPSWMDTPCADKSSRDCVFDPTNPHYQGQSFYNIRINRESGLWCRVYFDDLYAATHNFCGHDGNLEANR